MRGLGVFDWVLCSLFWMLKPFFTPKGFCGCVIESFFYVRFVMSRLFGGKVEKRSWLVEKDGGGVWLRCGVYWC